MIYKRFKMILLLSYMAVASFSAASITPALPIIEHVYHLAHGQVEWLVSLFLVGYVLGQLLYGPLAKRYSSLSALRFGLALNLVGIGLSFLALQMGSFWLLGMARLVTALGAAAGLSCTYMLLQTLYPKQSKRLLSYSMLAFTGALGLSVLVGGLVTQYLQWQAIFWMLLVHGGLMFIGTYAYRMPARVSAGQNEVVAWKVLLAKLLQAMLQPQLWRHALALGLCSIVGYSYAAAAPQIAHHLLHLNPAQYGMYNLYTGIGMLLSAWLAVIGMRTIGAKRLLRYALLALLVVCFSLGLQYAWHSQSALWFFSSCTMIFCASGLLFPAASHCALAG